MELELKDYLRLGLYLRYRAEHDAFYKRVAYLR